MGGCCNACEGLDSAIEIVENWSQQSFGKKSINRLSHVQLAAKLKALSQQLYAEQVKASHTCSPMQRRRVGVPETAEKSHLTIDRKYHPRNYTKFDKDLAILIYELGGGAALYALNKAPIMLPSRHTIANTRGELNLRITVGDVKVSDILANIEALFSDIDSGDSGPLKTFKMGNNLMCVEEAVKAVRAGDIHVGKEFSVAAFARHAPDDYGAKPVLLMPTCKKGSWQLSGQVLQKLIQAWKLSPFGEAKHGPLKEIASDGDGRQRAALYLVCMHKNLGPNNPIYQFLSDLTGLNLYTGEDGLCTLLCSLAGILVNKVVITKTLIAQWFEKIPGYDWSDESIHALLNPKDPQDVGRAVKLLCLIAELHDLDTSDFTLRLQPFPFTNVFKHLWVLTNGKQTVYKWFKWL
ncbi:hypothetical protein B0H10DRAFT_1961936 [Mycena sp. CBHHK59/15]|nr:hypothetical protein B0H10DRAFT_1961936 [Mycena sp. CBHHK59/15]